jgi:hypothetical protein
MVVEFAEKLNLKKKQVFPVEDYINSEERKRLGVKSIACKWNRSVGAMDTGEIRPPKIEEWYLSGGPVGAYKAPNDLTQTYHIARLVKVNRVEYFEVSEK